MTWSTSASLAVCRSSGTVAAFSVSADTLFATAVCETACIASKAESQHKSDGPARISVASLANHCPEPRSWDATGRYIARARRRERFRSPGVWEVPAAAELPGRRRAAWPAVATGKLLRAASAVSPTRLVSPPLRRTKWIAPCVLARTARCDSSGVSRSVTTVTSDVFPSGSGSHLMAGGEDDRVLEHGGCKRLGQSVRSVGDEDIDMGTGQEETRNADDLVGVQRDGAHAIWNSGGEAAAGRRTLRGRGRGSAVPWPAERGPRGRSSRRLARTHRRWERLRARRPIRCCRG